MGSRRQRQQRGRRGVTQHVGGGAASWAGPRCGRGEQAGTGSARQAGANRPTWAVQAVLVGKGKMARVGLPLLGRDGQLGWMFELSF
jgi:hypothetical protein